MKLLCSFLLSFCLIGCVSNRQTVAPPKPSPPTPTPVFLLNGDNLEDELTPLTVEGSKIIVMDWSYGALTEGHTRRLIAEALTGFNPVYVVEAYDCSDIAFSFMLRLRALYLRDCQGAPVAAPVGLVGAKMVEDMPDLGIQLYGGYGYHAMNVVRHAGGWLIVEPSLGRVAEFTGFCYGGELEVFILIF